MKNENKNLTALNTDEEIWREIPDDFYSPSIFTSMNRCIGINVGGFVILRTAKEWHHLGAKSIGCLCELEELNEKCPIHFPLRNNPQ